MSNTPTSTAAASPAPEDEPHRIHGGTGLPSADAVQAALRKGKTPATEPQIAEICWLLEHGRRVGIRNYRQLGKLIGYSESALSRLLRGVYEAGYEDVTAEIAAFRELTAKRAAFGDRIFVPGLSVVRHVTSLCDLTRQSQTIALLFGPNQSGKTTALHHYRDEHNHGRTVVVRMPVGGGERVFLEALAEACGIARSGIQMQIKAKLYRYFGPNILLIVDEVHQTMIGRSLKVNTIEFIRELHDLTGAGVVLCGTDVLPQMFENPKFASFLAQVANRGVLRRRIPPAPSAADLTALRTAYGLPEPTGEARIVYKSIGAEHGVGRLSKMLTMARSLAKKEAFGWAHFLTTVATLKSWAAGEQEGGAE